LVFWSDGDDGDGTEGGIFSRLADGSGRATRLTSSTEYQGPNSFSPDGEQLIYRQNQNLYILSLEDSSISRLLIEDANSASISPNGRWLAYYAVDESQEGFVYVRPFPNVNDGGPWQVSAAGGHAPHWTADGRQLIYRTNDAVMNVDVEDGPTFSTGRPEALFTRSRLVSGSDTYDVSRDGESFLIIDPAEQLGRVAGLTTITVVENWFEELRALSPPNP
jgi:Tol biopolymer transport system component